ncbi:MAG: DedA family protein [Candidatus Levybacteria bacterium]|nr:DedA family protein [Candidatus Levybacteria bacterium]
MIENLISLVSSLGYIGVFLVMMFNSDFIPLFTEATLPFAGFMASQGKLLVPLIILAAVLGDLVGGVIAYYIGYFLEENVILSAVRKYGKYVLLKESDYQKTTSLIRKHGASVVFFAKLTPGLKAWTSVGAGICEIKLRKFLIASVSASIIYNSILVLAGYYLGKNWNIIVSYFNKLQFIPLVLITIGIFWYIKHKLKIVKPPKLVR